MSDTLRPEGECPARGHGAGRSWADGIEKALATKLVEARTRLHAARYRDEADARSIDERCISVPVLRLDQTLLLTVLEDYRRMIKLRDE